MTGPTTPAPPFGAPQVPSGGDASPTAAGAAVAGRTGRAVALVVAIAVAAGLVAGFTGRASVTATAAAEDAVPATSAGTAAPPLGVARVVAEVVEVGGVGPRPMATVAPAGSVPTTAPAPAVLAPPVRLSLPSLGIDAAPVIEVGLLDNGGMEVPDVSLVGWYRYGPSPGETGTAVLAAHVAYGGRNGVFAHLEDLQPGDPLVVRHADGVERRWLIAAVEQHDKEALPVERLFTRAGAPTLALITCGGEFEWSTGHYRDNVVVFARPA